MPEICNHENTSLFFKTPPEVSQSRKQKLKISIQELVGTIPHTDLSLSELREERLAKYDQL